MPNTEPRFLSPNETLIDGQVCTLVDPEIATAKNAKTGAIYSYGVVSAVPVDRSESCGAGAGYREARAGRTPASAYAPAAAAPRRQV